jgi:hypothetical protein
MSRRRTNDPKGVSGTPNVTTDPEREKELVSELCRRVAHVQQGYRISRKAFGPLASFNESLARLKRGLNGQAHSGAAKRRLHPEIEIVISHHAKQYAVQRVGVPDAHVTPGDIEMGARKALALLKPRRGRPSDPVFTLHVEGLMALIQNYLGQPVMMQPKTNSVYDPQTTSEAGKILIMLAQQMEPKASIRAIITVVNKARVHYAGREMHFLDLFPGYGATIDEVTGLPKLRRGLHIEQQNWASPIYCG